MKKNLFVLLSLVILLCCNAFTAQAADKYTEIEIIPGEQTTLIDQNGVLLYLTGNVTEQEGSTLIEYAFENNSSKEITMQLSVYVNGWTIYKDVYFGDLMGVLPSTKYQGNLFIHHDKCDINSYEDIEEILFSSIISKGNGFSAVPFANTEVLKLNIQHPVNKETSVLSNKTQSGDVLTAGPKQKVILFDQEGVKCYLTGAFSNEEELTRIFFAVENNTDKILSMKFTLEINGWEIFKDSFVAGMMGIEPGGKVKRDIAIRYEKSDITCYEDIEEMKISITACEGDDTSSKAFSETVKKTIHFTTNKE